MEAQNKHKFKFLIKRISKRIEEVRNEYNKVIEPEKCMKMWGLFALEDIPAGAFVLEYIGEIITKKEGDQRGKEYDKIGMSYLFDMIDPDESNEFEMQVQACYNDDFFPLCIDAANYGNESRFINHSC